MNTASPPPRPPSPPLDSSSVFSAWPRSAQLATAFLLGVALTLLVIHLVGQFRWSTRPTDFRQGGIALSRIDLNTADRIELAQLPGIGEHLAGRIVDHRRENGRFRNVDELAVVRGLGPATVERVRDYVHVDGEETSDQPSTLKERNGAKASMKAPVKNRSTRKKTGPTDPIDINSASSEALQQVPGIGPAIAQRILDERHKAPFQKVEDLCRVPGIKEKLFERLRPFVTVGQ